MIPVRCNLYESMKRSYCVFSGSIGCPFLCQAPIIIEMKRKWEREVPTFPPPLSPSTATHGPDGGKRAAVHHSLFVLFPQVF